MHVNLASVVVAWNVLQHFFPYFDVIDTDWNKVLGETLKSTFENKQKKDYFVTMSQMFAKIDDGHGIVFGEHMYHLPIKTEFIEDEIIITASINTLLKRGDIIKEIDGKSIIEELEEKEKIISGSPQLRRHRALNILGSKFDSGKANLVIERDDKEQNVTVSNSSSRSMFFNPIDEREYLSDTIVEIEPGIYYVNLTNCAGSDFDKKIDVLANAKAVIYDQRGGNQLGFFHVIPYLIKEPVVSTWWNIPQTIYPDRKGVVFSKSNWSIRPQKPFFKSKTIIINVPSVVSAGETEMGIIDCYHLATTVGEPTAGCNGNINTIELPYGYYAWFTGMKVLKHDSSQLYIKGFQPDYPVKKTIQAVKEGRDEYLEKALEIARNE
jgi:Periplasmic protease